ncbi:cysteinyl-tRNA synthetase [Prosthecobacter fusiformis]|uniref:Cysteine--tRNA ligase n=1 Tax=Prosthecobacter fusiformis TaxID=48464 RepID=A0A4R7RP70_9BACT|nr:cysteine--tRNA ligase [Prosthecobacter fusiformis]TDU67280.1 cysteinyl-tRNA synthetase [Prosthecobacter fusiformis]
MPLTLHDTLSRSPRLITPLDGKTLRFYCCGPTVYGPAHIGNFRTFVAQDVFRRVIEQGGLATLHVRNLTDVDDKTIRDSQKAGQSLTDFTQFWTEKFHADCAALNLLPPHVEPSAVAHIPHQIRMIETLIERGHAYATPDGSVYFKVASFADYGRLSHLEDRELKLGASSAATATDSDEYTKDSLADFALWKGKKAEDGPNYWSSPWGDGRPGWHLECSAMSLEYLGEDFDVHGGGVDLIFPHHENEIAQSCCATHGQFARHWFHVTHLMVDGGKMSKSLGNLYTLEDLKGRGYTPMDVRYVLISGHYRTPLNFTLHSLDAARQALQKLAKFDKAVREVAGVAVEVAGTMPGPFAAAWDTLNDDLNVPGALGDIFGTINKTKAATLSKEEAVVALEGLHFLLRALGLQLPAGSDEADTEVPADIAELAEKRWQAKQSKDWGTADVLRKELDAAGWVIKDSKEGYQVLRK